MKTVQPKSQAAMDQLQYRFIRLGYTARHLEAALEHIRPHAQLVIHVHLVEATALLQDTHYRNSHEVWGNV
jgi:predicted metal-dependent HD superfamily phosphohydrolase